ncbi:hypothetical protein SBA1_940033 [Candidatus Sulfotelmatobacter kueseliae]|uniref:Uncharacterized protein n=1 Tax=Candidatus Sulfotelmatobacter kueseliae TaxID=2042962 RepID=A0A2U3LCU2_9BACT|nr:hypothetical protein SBA1_940033 [Candidatus Sulfotelmatobacter kueseliae]
MFEAGRAVMRVNQNVGVDKVFLGHDLRLTFAKSSPAAAVGESPPQQRRMSDEEVH